MASPLPFPTFNSCSGDSPEDLRCKLMYTSEELQKVRAEGRLQETELWRLQELLGIMMKERDEAREECRRLQDCMLRQQTPAMGVNSASSFMHSSSMVSSPSSSPWSLQELEEHLNSDDFCPSVGAPTPLELQQALESLVRDCDKGEPLISHMKAGNESALGGSHQETRMETPNQALCYDVPPCLSLPESQANGDLVCQRSPSVRSLSRQSSSNSSSARVQQFQRGKVSMESFNAMATMSAGVTQLAPAIAMAGMVSNSPPILPTGSNAYANRPVASLVGSSVSTIGNESMPLMQPTIDSGAACPIVYIATVSDNVSCHASPPAPIHCNNGASPQMAFINNNSASCSMPVNANSAAFLVKTDSPPSSSIGNTASPIVSNGAGCMVKSLGCSTPTLPMATNVPTSSSHCHQQSIPTPVRQLHLPEPPEADPQVMLNSLPQKGKLLQAVMQAGPLLQTLLLAGPLPQWCHPPPALSMRDIPKVSLTPGHVLVTPAGNNGLPSTITRKRIAITEPGLQNRKQRRLSPSPTKKGKAAIRMVSGGSEIQELAAGSLSQLAAS